jgi:hypothetical protein
MFAHQSRDADFSAAFAKVAGDVDAGQVLRNVACAAWTHQA